jgi:hypothetical protein
MSDLDELYKKYIWEFVKKMSNKDECYQIFNYYSGKTGYKYINQFLLMDENEELFVKRFKQDIGVIKQSIKNMDECFDKAPVTKDDGLLLWRGMDKDLGLKIGDSVVLKNYTSCSYNLSVASQFTKETFSKQKKVNGTCCFYGIHVGEGISYLPLERYSKAGPLEGEVLLPRNLVMTYMYDETIGKTGKHKWLSYKTTVRHMKITKLNDTISDKKMIDMSEPIIHKEEKPVSPIKENTKIPVSPTKEKKKRTQKNKKLSPTGICPEGCIPINSVIKEQIVEGFTESLAPIEAAQNEPNKEKKKRCPKGTRKNKDGLCV